jgi:hypothetical protein
MSFYSFGFDRAFRTSPMCCAFAIIQSLLCTAVIIIIHWHLIYGMSIATKITCNIVNGTRLIIILSLRPYHPAVKESVRTSQAEYRILQRFYHCSARSNVQSRSALP